MARSRVLFAGALALGVVAALTALGLHHFVVEQPRELDREALARLDWTGILRGALLDVTRLRVRSGGLCHREPASEETLLDTTDVARISALIDGIEVDARTSGFSCMCCGEPTLEFYRGNRLVVELGVHHGTALRWNGWPRDARLTSRSSTVFVQWLADGGVPGPRDEVEELRKHLVKANAGLERWKSAMPPAPRSVWEARRLGTSGAVVGSPIDPPENAPPPQRGANNSLVAPGLSQAEAAALDDLERAFLEAIPDKPARILALLSWFGSGEGHWSGHPSYELIAETMLLRYAVEDVVTAADVPTLSEAQMEGAARYFASWSFLVYHRGEEKRLPPPLRKRLLDYVLKSDDEDKLHRARRAFEQ